MNDNTQDKFAILAQNYANNLPVKLAVINKQWQKLLDNFQQSDLVDFHRIVHTLCGSAGTYGYVLLSLAARSLEEFIRDILSAESLDKDQNHKISALMNNLNEAPLVPQHDIGKPQTHQEHSINNKLIFLFDFDEILFYELNSSLVEIGYKLKLIRNYTELASAAELTLPACIIVNSRHLYEDESSMLAQLRHQHNLCMICISDKDDLQTRLLAIRAGASNFILRPVNIPYLTKLLDRLCENLPGEIHRVLILDDSMSLAQYYALVLQEAGMEAMAITDPRQLMIAINEFQPNLLLLDLYMPFCSGLELAAVLRQEERYVNLPIIFISTENDKLKQLAAIGRGGDDFITKPILPQHLISIIKSRLKRSTMLMKFIKHDSLTRLLNHSYILQQLEIELVHAKRYGQSLVFAMVDLDHFKKINDKYGHLIGDSVLMKVAEFLSTHVRNTDFVGRFGGEEFAIIFPGTQVEEARTICEALCSKFAELEHNINDGVHISFSVGIAACPEFSNAHDLVEAADRALYKAKAGGRKRVIVL